MYNIQDTHNSPLDISLDIPLNIPLDIPLDIPISALKKHINEQMNNNNYVYELKFSGLNIFRSYKITHHTVKYNQINLPIYVLYNTHVDKSDSHKPVLLCNQGTVYFKKADIDVQFRKTLKMNENIKDTYKLPPELCKAQFYPGKYGVINIPTHQNEALVINLLKSYSRANKPIAIKIYLNNINVITGTHKCFDTEITQHPQNYLICPMQQWLEGSTIGPMETNNYGIINKVKQFTAQPINANISIMDESLNINTGNDLEIQVFTTYKRNIKCYNVTKKEFVNIDDHTNYKDKLIFYEKGNHILDHFNYTLADYGIKKNDVFELVKIPCKSIFVIDLTGKTLTFPFEIGMSVKRLKQYIQQLFGIPPVDQRLIHGGRQLEDHKLLTDYKIAHDNTIHLVLRLSSGECREYTKMNVQPGGFIEQRIYRDIHNNPKNWNTLSFEKYKFNIVNDIQYIGQMPLTYINASNYIKHNSPICYNDENLVNETKRRICYIKYITFKICITYNPLLNILCEDIFNNILMLFLNKCEIHM